MKTDDLILLFAAAAAIYIVFKAGKSGAAAPRATASGSPWAPDMLNGAAQSQGWIQDGNVMYSPDGTYYLWNPATSQWGVAGKFDMTTGAKLG